jgi:hypothetical protein
MRQQLVKRAIPLLELAYLDPHPRCFAGDAVAIIAPRRHPTAAVAIADKVGLQPRAKPCSVPGAHRDRGDRCALHMARPRRAVRPLPDSSGTVSTRYPDDPMVARSMSSADDIYYLALRDFGTLMVEKMPD